MNLNEREKKVLPLLVSGMSNQEIAKEINISEAVVKNCVFGLLKRFDAKNRVSVAVKAIELGLA